MISGEAARRPFIKAGAERSGGAGGGDGAAADMTHFVLLPAAPHTSKPHNKPPKNTVGFSRNERCRTANC